MQNMTHHSISEENMQELSESMKRRISSVAEVNSQTNKNPCIKENKLDKKISKFSTKEFADRMTCHGLQDWYGSTSKISFIFWGFVFILAATVLVVSIGISFKEYYVNPIQTSIHVTPTNFMKFPKVLICPSNFVNYSLTISGLETLELIDYFSSAQSGDGLLSLTKKVSDLFPLIPIIQTEKYGIDLAPEIKMQYLGIIDVSLASDKFIPECQFGSNICSKDIQRVVDKDFGVCYFVNLEEHQRVPNKGLGLVVDINSEVNDPDKPALSEGITLHILDQYSPVVYGGILVSPGTSSRIRLRKKYQHFISVNKFSESPQKCVSDGEVEFQIINASYSRETCRLDCIQQTIEPQFNCVLPLNLSQIKSPYYNENMEAIVEKEFFKLLKNLSITIIDPMVVGPYVQPIKDKYYADFTKFCNNTDVIEKINISKFNECAEKCHRSCDQYDIETEFSFHKLPSAQMLSKFSELLQSIKIDEMESNNVTTTAGSNLGEESMGPEGFEGIRGLKNVSRWSNNVIVLDIAFTNLELLSIVQSPAMTLNTLLSNLGGACGLWLGASIFTIMQLIVFVVQLCFTKCCLRGNE